MRARRYAAAVAALVGAALLASCSSIPSSGQVQFTSATASATPEQFIRVLARPPRDGSSPTDIVSGFLAASANFDDDHAVARTYLTAAAAQAWRPEAHVAVYESDPGFSLAVFRPGLVRMLAFEQAGDISARGQFTQPVGGPQFRANFGMAKVDGEWRIAAPPKGMILSTGDIARAYRALNLYFLDVAGGILVPDPVFLPAQQPGIATSLTRELLAGPTPWLAPAVRSGFPAGTKLALDSVPVQGGIARVDLEPRAVTATGEQRRQLAAQLTYTLTQLPDVGGVRITLGGVPFAIPGLGPVSTLADWEAFDPNASPDDPATYTIDAGHLSTVTTGATPVAGYFGTARGLTRAAVSLDGRSIVGSEAARSSSVVRFGAAGATSAAVVYTGRDVVALSFDRLGSAWLADRGTRGSTMWTARTGRRATRVSVQGLGGRAIEAIRVSRDGARIALVVSGQPGGPGVLLLGRVQLDTGRPIVAGLRRIENSLTDVRDVAWADDATVFVLAGGSGEVQSYSVGLDGDSIAGTGAVAGMRSVAACPGRPLLAGTTANLLWADRGTGWRPFVTGALPIYPG